MAVAALRAFRATAATNRYFLPNPILGSKEISKDRMRGFGDDFSGWQKLLESNPCAFMISVIRSVDPDERQRRGQHYRPTDWAQASGVSPLPASTGRVEAEDGRFDRWGVEGRRENGKGRLVRAYFTASKKAKIRPLKSFVSD